MLEPNYVLPKHWKQWDGRTVVVLASGPSMTQQDADYVEGKAKTITVNSSFRLAPWARAVGGGR